MILKKVVLLTIFELIFIHTSIAQYDYKIVVDKDIQLIHIQDSIFVHITWHRLENFGQFSSNGLIVIKNGQALMIDTPMDDDKTKRLTYYLKDSLSVDLTKLIIGHFHDDCLGGLRYLQSIGIESIANSLTIAKCKEIGLPIPSKSFTDSLTIDFNGEQIDCNFFGSGHSFDNITVWISNKKILFGGCLIRSIDSKTLGNLSDSVLSDWDKTIEKIIKKYSETEVVIPGHGHIGGKDLLTHTIELIKKEKIKKN